MSVTPQRSANDGTAQVGGRNRFTSIDPGFRSDAIVARPRLGHVRQGSRCRVESDRAILASAHARGRWSAGIPKRPKGADCKSVGICLRRFESFSRHGVRRTSYVVRTTTTADRAVVQLNTCLLSSVAERAMSRPATSRQSEEPKALHGKEGVPDPDRGGVQLNTCLLSSVAEPAMSGSEEPADTAW